LYVTAGEKDDGRRLASGTPSTDNRPMQNQLIANKYELVAVAGQGGMATVWRGVMRGAASFARPVAVKHILPQLSSDPEFVAMFVEEARVGSQLQHPNIVQIIDFEQERQSYYLIMEWVEGLDLSRYLAALQDARQPPPWPLITAICVDALRGLSAAHERLDGAGKPAPVYHRDVAPQNMLIGVNGIVKLTDFGLARAMDRARMTSPLIIKGKLRYLSPELTLGNPATVQSDLFSMGVVLWEALAQEPLYKGATDVEVFMQARKGEIPSLAARRGDLPAPLVQVIDRALARDPAQRFASAKEMLREMTQLLRHVPQFTDAYAISESVGRARQLIAQAAPPAPHPPPIPK